MQKESYCSLTVITGGLRKEASDWVLVCKGRGTLLRMCLCAVWVSMCAVGIRTYTVWDATVRSMDTDVHSMDWDVRSMDGHVFIGVSQVRSLWVLLWRSGYG